MRTVGFPISSKEHENRRAIVPGDIAKLTHPELIRIESGFGDVLGLSDDEYRAAGCRVCAQEEVLRADVICDPKIGDADYLSRLHRGQTIFGWIHATQNREITDTIIRTGLTAYGWEKMFDSGRHVFWFNNELAGEAAVLHAFQCYGELPFGLNVAVIGNGNTARGAVRVLNMLGAHVMQYTRRMEDLLREEIGKYDVVVNCVLWDVRRTDHIIYREDLKRMKKNSMIVDVSCDRHGGIETSVPTSIEKPTYMENGVLHYAVDHTPSLFYKTFSFQNSKIIVPYIEQFIQDRPGKTLQDCLLIRDGEVIDQEINSFQKR